MAGLIVASELKNVFLFTTIVFLPSVSKAQKEPDPIWVDKVTIKLCEELEVLGERVQVVPGPDHRKHIHVIRTSFLRQLVIWNYEATELNPSWNISKETATIRWLASEFKQSRFDAHCVHFNVNKTIDRGLLQPNSCNWKPQGKKRTEWQRFCQIEGYPDDSVDRLFDARTNIRFTAHLNEIFIQRKMKRWVYDYDVDADQKKIYTSLIKLVDDVPPVTAEK